MALDSLFEHPEALAVGISIILFAISFEVIFKSFKNKTVSLIVSLVLSLIVGFGLYEKRFYGMESVLALVLVIVVVGIFVKMILGLGRNMKRAVGRYRDSF